MKKCLVVAGTFPVPLGVAPLGAIAAVGVVIRAPGAHCPRTYDLSGVRLGLPSGMTVAHVVEEFRGEILRYSIRFCWDFPLYADGVDISAVQDAEVGSIRSLGALERSRASFFEYFNGFHLSLIHI